MLGNIGFKNEDGEYLGARGIKFTIFPGSGLRKANNANSPKWVMAGELVDKYSVTEYAGMGALLAARVQADAGDTKSARVQLAWAAENARDAGMRDLARLRLATLMLDDKAYDEALKQLAAEPAASFAPRFGELRGDVHVAQGRQDEARKAYDAALASLDSSALKLPARSA